MCEEPYVANPHFYAGSDGKPFGAFALTEGTDTVLPKAPRYAVDGEVVTVWRLCLVSTTEDSMIGDADYFEALEKLKKYAYAQDEKTITVRALTLEELKGI